MPTKPSCTDNKELIKICKELNGKELLWELGKIGSGVYCPVIILANPKIAERVSVKPYRKTPRQVYNLCVKAGLSSVVTKETVKSPTFCFSTISIIKGHLLLLQELNKAEKEVNLLSILEWQCYGQKPVCPY